MPLIDTPDGHYTHAVTTAGEGDGNDVVYDNWINPGRKTPVWDKFSYEANLGAGPAAPGPAAPDPPPPPTPVGPATPDPTGVPPAGDLGPIRMIPVTDASDGLIIPRTYSYWANAFLTGTEAYVFCGVRDRLPQFFSVSLPTGRVTRLGGRLPYPGESEGWYWDRDGWIVLIDGSRLRRVNPVTLEDQILADLNEAGHVLWQAHSSDDGQVHSATVQEVHDSGNRNLGTMVWRRGQPLWYPAIGLLDESQIDASGRWLLIKETIDNLLQNRVINVETGEERRLANWGAVGHSDMGEAYVVGESSPQVDGLPGACVLWRLDQPLIPQNRRVLYPEWNVGHVAVRGRVCLVSDTDSISTVNLDTGNRNRLINHGMVGSGYDNQVKANLDPSGRIACYLSNRGTDRQDVFLLTL